MKKKILKTAICIVASCSLVLNFMLSAKIIQQYNTYDDKINTCIAEKKDLNNEIINQQSQLDIKDNKIKTLENDITKLQTEITNLKKN